MAAYDHPLDHVEVGREVARLGDDAGAAGAERQGRAEHLEEVDGGGVGDDDVALAAADQPRDLAPGAERVVHPAVLVPARDEVPPPLPLDDLRHALRHPSRQRAERVAVEVDRAVRQREARAHVAQRVGRVHRLAVRPRRRLHRRARCQLASSSRARWGRGERPSAPEAVLRRKTGARGSALLASRGGRRS